MQNHDVRWKQRFENFAKASKLLSEIQDYPAEQTLAIIREGFVQRFEVTFELAWKPLRDLLEHEGVRVQPTPRAVLKEAFAANFIEDGQLFMDMLEARNLVAHKYDEETFTAVFLQIQQKFEPALTQLCAMFEGKL